MIGRRFLVDVVVIQHALNDVWPRLWPDYKVDYSHYRTPYKEIEFTGLNRMLLRISHLWCAGFIRTSKDRIPLRHERLD